MLTVSNMIFRNIILICILSYLRCQPESTKACAKGAFSLGKKSRFRAPPAVFATSVEPSMRKTADCNICAVTANLLLAICRLIHSTFERED